MAPKEGTYTRSISGETVQYKVTKVSDYLYSIDVAARDIQNKTLNISGSVSYPRDSEGGEIGMWTAAGSSDELSADPTTGAKE